MNASVSDQGSARGWLGGTAHVQIPRSIYIPLAATLVMFLASNTFYTAATVLMNAVKWAPMGLLLVMGMSALSGRRYPQCPPTLFFALMLMFGLGVVGSYLGLQPAFGILPLVSVVLCIGTAYVAAAALVVTDSRRAFFDLIAVLGRVMLVACVLFYLARINMGRGQGFAAWVDNPNTLAAMLAPSAVVFFAGCIERRPGWIKWDLSFLIVALPMIALTNGRASFIWVGLSMLVFWLYRRGSWITMIAAIVATIAMIGWWDVILAAIGHWLQVDIAPERAAKVGPLSGREEVWRIGWQLFTERPTFGYGFGSSQILLQAESWRFVRHQGIHFHSSYLMSLVETGLFGFILFMVTLIATIVRGILDGRRTRLLPRESWPTTALPLAMMIGAMGHALFESWLIAAGNVNTLMFWTCVWLIHFQAQIPLRAVPQNRAPIRERSAAALLRAR